MQIILTEEEYKSLQAGQLQFKEQVAAEVHKQCVAIREALGDEMARTHMFDVQDVVRAVNRVLKQYDLAG